MALASIAITFFKFLIFMSKMAKLSISAMGKLVPLTNFRFHFGKLFWNSEYLWTTKLTSRLRGLDKCIPFGSCTPLLQGEDPAEGKFKTWCLPYAFAAGFGYWGYLRLKFFVTVLNKHRLKPYICPSTYKYSLYLGCER